VHRAIRAGLARILPEHALSHLLGELRISAKRAVHSRSVRRRLACVRDRRVNIGCGSRPTAGWINLDLWPLQSAFFWDCRRGLPFADNTVTAIYTEHVFEHLDLETEAKRFLRECRRCLQPDAVLRIVVPDAGAYLRAYGQTWAPLAAMRPLEPTDEGWRDPWLGDIYQTQMQLINAVFRQREEHKYAYDEETLTLLLREAGFSQIIPQRFAVSIDEQMAPDNEARQNESLYIEAVK
jgi:predicted SAM-dependent methyltransferase